MTAETKITAMRPFDVAEIRADFPILGVEVYGKPLAYLDNAASAQKPRAVIDKMVQVMEQGYANVHRGLHYLSNHATAEYEQARKTVARYLNAKSADEIIYTAGTTDSLNLVADSFGADLGEGDEIILSVLEHHSNIVPWHFLRERKGVVLRWIDITDQGELRLDQYEEAFNSRTRLVAITQMSNALGTILPAKDLIETAHGHGVPVLLDGAQGAVHLGADVQDLDVDFYAFNGHKLFGPTGIGILYAKADHLKRMRPYRGGGEMIGEVALDRITYADPPHRFEAGTPPIIEAIGLGAAIEYVMQFDRAHLLRYEAELLVEATDRLREINSVEIYGTAPKKGSIVSFGLKGAHPHDISTIVDREGVAVRAGHHCAQPLMDRLGVTATARASFAFYNTRDEIEQLVQALHKAQRMLG